VGGWQFWVCEEREMKKKLKKIEKVRVVKRLWCPGVPRKKLAVTWTGQNRALLFVFPESAQRYCIDDEIPIMLRVTVEEI
jgi:uncharacterized protein YbaR (Trm112 family)